MIRKIGLIAAMSALTLQAGIAPTALSEEAEKRELQCEEILQITDLDELQKQLTELIRKRPNDPCVNMIVAQISDEDDNDITGDSDPY